MERPLNRTVREQAILPQVLVLYEDLAAGQRAHHLLCQITRQEGIELGLTRKMWRFDLFDLPAAREEAALEAEAADVILLSVNRKTLMTTEEQHWIARWLDGKTDRPCLVCLLQGPEGIGQEQANPLIAEIRDITRSAGADFFCGRIAEASPVADASPMAAWLHPFISSSPASSNFYPGRVSAQLGQL